MSKPSAPKAPDPKETAAAQTSTNVSTAIANSWLGNVNQVTPDGKLTYDQTGKQFINDANGQKYWRRNDGLIVSKQPGENDKRYTEIKGYYTPTFTATQTLSPQQKLIKKHEDKTSEHLARTAREQAWDMRNFLNTSINTSKLPASFDWSSLGMPNYQTVGSGPKDLQTSYTDDFSKDRKRVEDAMMGRLQPTINRDRASLETNLQNQGIRIGSDAWTNAMSDFDRGVSDQRTSVLLAGGDEQSRLANLAHQQASFGNTAKQQMYDNILKGAGFNNSVKDQRFNATAAIGTQQDNARQRALQETFALRNQPINEISGLLSGSQVTQPNFMNIQGASIPTVDYAGIVQQNYANQMGGYNTQMAQLNSALGGLFGLGAAGIKASDRRLKRDIRRIGTYRNGLPKYSFRYRHGGRRFIGLMSDDVRKVRPEAVTRIDGYDAVNYRKALA